MSERENGTKPLLPPVYFLFALILSAVLHYLWPVAAVIAEPWNWTGLPLIVIGILGAGFAARSFAAADTPIRPFEKSTALVVTGFYRYTRNPMYLGMVLILLGTDLLFGSLLPFIVLPFFAGVIQRRFICHEEAALDAIFGDSYRSYRRSVRRWL